MSGSRTIWLVARRELIERAATKGYLIGTAITLLIVVGAVVLPTLFGDDGPAEFALGVVGDAPPDLDQQLGATAPEDTTVTTQAVADRDDAVADLEAGDWTRHSSTGRNSSPTANHRASSGRTSRPRCERAPCSGA